MLLSFELVGAARSYIVTCARQEFAGRILGKIVPQSLPKDARAGAVANDRVAVPRDGFEMPEGAS